MIEPIISFGVKNCGNIINSVLFVHGLEVSSSFPKYLKVYFCHSPNFLTSHFLFCLELVLSLILSAISVNFEVWPRIICFVIYLISANLNLEASVDLMIQFCLDVKGQEHPDNIVTDKPRGKRPSGRPRRR